MKKYRITVTRTEEYEVEVDENVWNETAIKNWSTVFEDINGTQELAEKLAIAVSEEDAKYGEYEGFGVVKLLNDKGEELYNEIMPYTPGLEVKVLVVSGSECSTEVYDFEANKYTN